MACVAWVLLRPPSSLPNLAAAAEAAEEKAQYTDAPTGTFPNLAAAAEAAEEKAQYTDAPPGTPATHFLLYLNDQTWKGADGERLAHEVPY